MILMNDAVYVELIKCGSITFKNQVMLHIIMPSATGKNLSSQ
jgi:hypothetical protein